MSQKKKYLIKINKFYSEPMYIHVPNKIVPPEIKIYLELGTILYILLNYYVIPVSINR